MLMHHVLRAILVFHLMALDMNQDGFRCLERVCREFVWGLGEQGNPRAPLVAWAIIVHPTTEGGLVIMSFQEHALLLKLRCATQLIIGSPTTWVEMARILIWDSLRSGSRKKERKTWTPSEALLL